ncbi:MULTISPECIES: signal peptidase II [unclassified Nocardioides]|uniref:signal peptidase II n=1 Tax=unclassified Nocardioides TaxID=2615069 RepID=UPI0006F3B826|nr:MULTISPECIES: signal peptidase II [unclassified Nocardioides]KRA37360.1 peptidase A8, signal peptidase II [Nocardioides sp. Root614]KRA91321.1 peptidase A8, signal peptidase II [Nocardioides sp. Root682]
MQAARGTPVDDRDDGSQPVRPSRVVAPRTWALFLSVAVVLVLTDQITKVLAVRHLAGEPDKQVVGDLLQLHLTYNPGAAFSLGTRFTVALAVLACTATLVVLWLSRRVDDRVWAVGLGLLLAGIVGNLLDRLLREPGPFRGHVVDFLMLPNWPVFNVADICINLGVGLILIQVLRGIAIDGTRQENA